MKTSSDFSNDAANGSVAMFEESLQRYKFLSLTTNEGIWDYNLETGLTYYNKGISRLFGYNKEDMKDNFIWMAR